MNDKKINKLTHILTHSVGRGSIFDLSIFIFMERTQTIESFRIKIVIVFIIFSGTLLFELMAKKIRKMFEKWSVLDIALP